MEKVEQRKRNYIIIVSILIHIVLLFLMEISIKLKLFGFGVPQTSSEISEPIIFDLQNPQKPREVVETPKNAKTEKEQKNAKLLSDKHALAKNTQTDPNLKVDEPFARGEFKAHELPKKREKKGKGLPLKKPDESAIPEKKEEKKRIPTFSDFVMNNIRKKYMEDKDTESGDSAQPGEKESFPTVRFDNQKSRAVDMGGFSFNTYDWNFAPYLLMLKKRIQRNIHPPLAFTRLGMISGQTLLRFKIYPDGELRDLEILGFNGHKSLMQTSHTAVYVSAPFPKLPADFPEPYLEVTGLFQYLIYKK
jgi:outer membrane biosynthesis protein TonB